MSEDNEYIKFDIGKVLDLKDVYCEVMQFVQQDFPECNLNSSNQIKGYFWDQFNSVIPDTKIQTFKSLMELYPETHPLYEAAEQLSVYLKAKYTLKNYINCILKHENDGIITLRKIGGNLVMPNKQPLSYNDEISQCVLSISENAQKHIPNYMQ